MFKHIVCFKLKDGSKESRERAKGVLLGMDGNVDTLRGLEVHVDELRSARSYDVILEVFLDSREALDVYQDDPYHCDVVKRYMKDAAVSSVTMDFEL